MIQIPGLNRRNLELLIDSIINAAAVFIEFKLTSDNIQNIYDLVLGSSYNIKQAIREQYANGNKVLAELTEEGKMRHRERMSRRYGSTLKKLYDEAKPYQDNLLSLLLPEDITDKLRELINYYLKLTGLQAGYAPMAPQITYQTPPQKPL